MRQALALLALVALSGAAPGGAWDEVAWPFGRDAWPAGRAFRCRDCDLQVYVRPKLGFCNCSTGVTDDSEVDAVSDMDMLSPDFAAANAGEPVWAGGLAGRARRYVTRLPDGTVRDAAGYALSSKCDLLVAAALGRDAADRGRVTALLELPTVAGWVAVQLGRASALVPTK